jgi:replicative DNA helicase
MANVEKVLPSNTDAERFVLGAIMLDNELFPEAASALSADDFLLESHRRIFRRMIDLNATKTNIDRVTVANELMKNGELESVGGVSYLVSLDDGLPQTPNIDSYIAIVKDKSLLRKVINSAAYLTDQCMAGSFSGEEVLAGARENLLALTPADKSGPQSAYDIIANFPGGMTVFLDPAKRDQGLTTGFRRFDDMTCGLHPEDLIVIAGRPGMGKSALALNIAQHNVLTAKTTRPVAIFSLEMSKESLLQRLLCCVARVDSQKYRMGYLDQNERRKLNGAQAAIAEAPLYIDDTGGARVVDIQAKLQRLISHKSVGLAIIDYLQLMEGKGNNRVEQVSGISRGLKLMAKEFKIPIIALSQLSRAVEQRKGDHRPQLSDLRESGAIEQDADLVTFIFRPEVYSKEEHFRGEAELIIAKQRSGPIGPVKLVFLHALTKFENRAEDVGDFLENE